MGSEAATPAPATSETIEQRTRGLGARVRSRSEDGHEDSMFDEDRVAVMLIGSAALCSALVAQPSRPRLTKAYSDPRQRGNAGNPRL